MKKITCAKCNNIIDPSRDRAFIFSNLPAEKKRWPFPGLNNMLTELKYFNIVKCSKCGNEFKSSASKILNVFSPLGFLLFIVAFDILVVLYFLFFVVKK